TFLIIKNVNEKRVAVGCSSWLDPLVGSKIIGLNKLPFSDCFHTALECVPSEIAISSFRYTIMSASTLEEDKSMMVKQTASLEKNEPRLTRLTCEDEAKRFSVTDIGLCKLLVSRRNLIAWISPKPESPHCGINRFETCHDAKLFLHEHSSEAAPRRRERSLWCDRLCRYGRFRVKRNTLARVCAGECDRCERQRDDVAHGSNEN